MSDPVPLDSDQRRTAELRSAWSYLFVKQPARAQRLATRLLREEPDYAGTWNHGNLLHHAHLILGFVALDGGEIDRAVDELAEAGRTPGSPQLNSFGPNMSLAAALLERGRRDAVLAYLQACGEFWQEPERLDSWRGAVESGDVPDFGPNLVYGM